MVTVVATREDPRFKQKLEPASFPSAVRPCYALNRPADATLSPPPIDHETCQTAILDKIR